MLRLETGMHTNRIVQISTDAAHHLLLTVSFDKTARLWSLPDGKPTRVLRPPIGAGDEGKLYCGTLSPDGRLAAVAGWTGYEWDRSFSVYLFDTASGKMVGRLAGLPEVVHALAFSPDGGVLAAGLGKSEQGGKGGIRVWRTVDWHDAWSDGDYGGAVYGLAFTRSGQLVASSFDGFLRSYDPSGQPGPKTKAPGGKRPFQLAISPDDETVAVAYQDTGRVDLLSSADLQFASSPDVRGVQGSLGLVAWSADSSRLFGAGNGLNLAGQTSIRTWLAKGRGAHFDQGVARGEILALAGLSNETVAFATAESAWGILNASAGVSLLRGPHIIDFGDEARDFKLSADGRAVRFDILERQPRTVAGSPRRQSATFTLDGRQVNVGGTPGPASIGPEASNPRMNLTGGRNGGNPMLNGKVLQLEANEIWRAAAVHGDRLLLGTEWGLRLFNQAGSQVWWRDVAAPGSTKAVNVTPNGKLAVAAFADGTIHWYGMRDGAELLAVFPHGDGRRWIAWTPRGYYDASAGADRLLVWHKNQGADHEALDFPVEKFAEQYNRSDVVAAAFERPEPDQPLWVARPVLKITSPAPKSPVFASPLDVTYEVISPSPVLEVRVRVDGEPVAIPPPHLDVPGAPLTVSVPVPAHDAVVTLVARSSSGLSEPVELRYKWGGAQEDGNASLKPDLYVLAVGVSDYQVYRPKLHYAAGDAEKFVRAMEAQEGGMYGRVHGKSLTDQNATLDNIRRELDDLRRRAAPRDAAILFMSGHGWNDAQRKYHYLPYEGDTSNLYLTAMVDTEIAGFLGRIPAKVFVFLDTCFAGSFGYEKGPTQPDVDRLANMLASEDRRVVVFASSTGDQFSQERPEWGRGAFTKALLEAFQTDRADYTRQGTVSVLKLDRYLSKRVHELTGGEQTPMFKMKEKDDLVFAMVRS